ncbi:SRPBCC family protein [Vogesella sp. LIG4]|uniref:SRPBCC family protein n=1 Tax=Vogesella sp. LIG4 TaxID=1192162 RepID=UPI00081F90BC|nr:SRPBCC family protein [Vogesella sp. LIG4]SCK27586.1 Polyketide cyclase / dehydrase and lipid transport [Vogesella sp. LIG4]
MAEYRFCTQWRFDAPLEEVWRVIYDVRSWPQWWQGVEEVLELAPGDAAGVGARQRYVWKGALPYRLSFDVHITAVQPLALLVGRASGEVEGVGCWQFSREQGATVVRYLWQVRTTRRWMNWLAPLARPLFEWNHDYLMEAGRRGLCRQLARPAA